MRHATLRRRLRDDVLFQIGLTWLALLAVPSLVQIVQGEAITTIGQAAPALAK